MTDGVEGSTLDTELSHLHEAYIAWRVSVEKMPKDEVFQSLLDPLVETGIRAVRSLVEMPEFTDLALRDTRGIADRRVQDYRRVVGDIKAGAEFAATRRRMEQLIRLHTPLGATAISWGLREGLGLRTCGEAERYLSRKAEDETPNFTVPEHPSAPKVGAVFKPREVRLADAGAPGAEYGVEYLPRRLSDRVMGSGDAGEVTLSGMRRIVTMRVLRHFQQDPTVKLSNKRFHEIVQETIGAEHPMTDLTAAYRNVRNWWETSFTWNRQPIIQCIGGGSGRSDKMSFALNPSVLPLVISVENS